MKTRPAAPQPGGRRRRARLRRPSQVWGRKVAAVGAALIVAAGAAGLVSVAGGDDSGPADAASPVPAPLVPPLLAKEIRNKRDGVALAYPAGWRRSKGTGSSRSRAPTGVR